jgi:outer membrane protein
MSNNMLKLFCLIVGVFFASQVSSNVKYEFEMASWRESPKVIFGEDKTSLLTFSDDRKTNYLVQFELEHDNPNIPNFQISQFSADAAGSQQIVQTFFLSGTKYNVGSVIQGSAEYASVTGSMYYEAFDNRILELDLGVGLNQHSIFVSTENANNLTNASERDVTMLVPAFYARTRMNLRLLRTGFEAEAFVSNSDDYRFNFNAYYTFIDSELFKLKGSLGYLNQTFKTENLSGLYFESNRKEWYTGLVFSF